MTQEKVSEAARILGSEIENALVSLKSENQLLHKQMNTYPAVNFTNISEIFAKLAQVSGELNISYFNQFFQNISNIAIYCTEVENLRAHKKVAVLSLDIEDTLVAIQGALSDKEKLKLVRKSMELIDHKLDRLRRGEFYSLISEKKEREA